MENCWQYMKCGRGPREKKEGDPDTCPAATDKRLEGTNSGHNGGRICWAVAGTMCNGSPQGSFVDKYENCASCDFFLKVKNEEGAGFEIVPLCFFSRD